MKIGKLDPKNLFDKSAESEYLEKEKEMFNNIVIGKLNTNNIFENDQTKEVEKKTIQVGKIKTKVLFIFSMFSVVDISLLQELFTEADTYVAKPYVTVGKLKIKVRMLLSAIMVIMVIRLMNILHISRNRIYSRRRKKRILNKHHRLEKFKPKICLAAALTKTKVFYLISRCFIQ